MSISYPIRVGKSFKEDLKKIKVKKMESGVMETDTTPSKITERITKKITKTKI